VRGRTSGARPHRNRGGSSARRYPLGPVPVILDPWGDFAYVTFLATSDPLHDAITVSVLDLEKDTVPQRRDEVVTVGTNPFGLAHVR
jgi:hypothetical protein